MPDESVQWRRSGRGRRGLRGGGRKATGLRAIEWAREARASAAPGEILLTSMDADGTRNGFDCELTAAVSEAVAIPVIASGGAGTAAHFADVFGRGRGRCRAGRQHLPLSAVSDARALEGELRRFSVPSEAAMLIPSIDLMGGRIVQLVQGEKLQTRLRRFRLLDRPFRGLSPGATDRSRRGDAPGQQPQAD